jgi:hypothetical protein
MVDEEGFSPIEYPFGGRRYILRLLLKQYGFKLMEFEEDGVFIIYSYSSKYQVFLSLSAN